MSDKLKYPDKKFIGEADEVIPGKFYDVLHAVIQDGSTIPIIGVPHKDVQFGVSFVHLHLDARFMNEGSNGVKNGRTNNIQSIHTVIGYIVKRKKCRNKNTEINPPPKNSAFEAGVNYHNWVDKMLGKSCKGKKCPHFGTAMAEIDGHLVCPLHNLMGDIQTEQITGASYQKY